MREVEYQKVLDEQVAQRIALWRAARGPLLNDQRVARALEMVIPRKARDRVAGDGTVAAVMSLTCDELLWPLSYMLLADEWRADLADAVADGARLGLVVAPPPPGIPKTPEPARNPQPPSPP